MDVLLQGLGQLVPIFFPVLGTLGSLGMVYLNRWLKTKIGVEATAVTSQLVESVVNDIQASTVEPIKRAAADGKLTRKEALDIKTEAVRRIKTRIPATVAKTVTRAVGDLDTFISGKIEQAIRQAKPPGNGNHASK